jgi:hypothetical protein
VDCPEKVYNFFLTLSECISGNGWQRAVNFSYYFMRLVMQGSTWTRRIFLFLPPLLLATLLTGFAEAEPNPEKIKNIKKLLLISGIQDQLSYMKNGVLNSYSQMIGSAYPKVPDAFWDDFNALIGDREMDGLVEQVIPVYDKHMSSDVIKELIKMFETPFWKEWKNKMPLISREAGIAGQKWVHGITQTEEFKQKIDSLVKKHELEKLNSAKENPEKNKDGKN